MALISGSFFYFLNYVSTKSVTYCEKSKKSGYFWLFYPYFLSLNIPIGYYGVAEPVALEYSANLEPHNLLRRAT
jgi:hypothetical protein